MATTVTLLPTSNDPRYVQRTQIAGVNYVLFFRFNAREGRWFVDVRAADTELTAIALGQKLVVGTPLFVNFPISLRPGGASALVLVVDQLDTDPQNQRDPGLNDLGGRHTVTVIEV